MKLIFAIIQTDDSDNVVAILNQQGYMVTKLNSTGGFLLQGKQYADDWYSGGESERCDPYF